MYWPACKPPAPPPPPPPPPPRPPRPRPPAGAATAASAAPAATVQASGGGGAPPPPRPPPPPPPPRPAAAPIFTRCIPAAVEGGGVGRSQISCTFKVSRSIGRITVSLAAQARTAPPPSSSSIFNGLAGAV